LFILKTPINAS